MNTSSTHRTAVAVGVAGVLALAGCGAATHHAGSGMMGGGTGYRYSPLTCSAPADPPGRVVTVTLADMGMSRMMGGDAPTGAQMLLRAGSASVAAGQVTFVGENRGRRTHELVILPLATGAQQGRRAPGPDGRIDETGTLGEASANCAGGTGDGIPAGAVGWVTLTLAAGQYELVCDQTNHYADGMHQEFTVTR